MTENLTVEGAIRKKCRMCVNVSDGMNEYSSSQVGALEQQGKMQLLFEKSTVFERKASQRDGVVILKKKLDAQEGKDFLHFRMWLLTMHYSLDNLQKIQMT